MDSAASQNGNGTAVKKIPVTVVTGFVGAGKTTLINYSKY